MSVMPKPIALICSDLHLHSIAPLKRLGDWQGDMWKSLKFVSDLANKKRVPVICCGDIFHAAQETPMVELMMLEFINRISNGFFSIPGQHDMRHHKHDLEGTSYKLMQKACENAGLCNIHDDVSFRRIIKGDDGILIYYVPWGKLGELPSIKKEPWQKLGIVAHELTFTECFPNSMSVSDWFDNFPQIDFFCIGDNHKSFVKRQGDRFVLSPGSLMNRAIDQADRTPFVYLLYSDLTIKRVANKYEKEVEFHDVLEMARGTEATRFCEAFENQDHEKISFYHALQNRRMKETGRVREILDELEGMLK